MSILAPIFIQQAGHSAARRFEVATEDPVGTQLTKLMEIVRRNQDTEYGREYRFADIHSVDDWRRLVPVISYEDIRERMDRVAEGAKNVFTAEDPVMFNQTSGTTGSAKYIPVTPTCKGRDHSDQMRTWIYHAYKKHHRLFAGKIVTLVSPAVEGYTEAGIPYGSTSGEIYQNMPKAVRGTYAIPYEVFLIKDYEAKYYTVMRIAVASKISFVATANPSSILMMCEKAQDHADELIRDIADGTLKSDLEIEPELRAKIEAILRKDPARARELEALRARRDGRLLPADYWPDLALIGCWKGGTVSSYIDQFPEWFDPDHHGMVPIRDWGYLSSEARCTIPLSDLGSAGVLTVGTNFYEFVSVQDVDEHPDDHAAWTFLGVDEVERDREYYIFITTTGGLYRYDINDVVEIMGTHNNTPTLVFKRKGRGMTNITGEKLSVNQVIAAFDVAQKGLGIHIPHFKAEPDQEGSRYVFKVEAPELKPDQRRRLLGIVDRSLGELNVEWESKRKSLRLNDPVLQVMKTGWYDHQKEELVASGKRLFQAKTVLLDSKQGYHPEGDQLEVEVTLRDEGC